MAVEWFVRGVSLVMAGGFLLVGALLLLMAVVGSRSSRSDLPADGAVAQSWRQAGLLPVTEPPDAVLRAAARLRTGVGVDGHGLFRLPGPTGVRLVASGEVHGRAVHVADVWHVTSVSSVGSEQVDATVRLRAVAAIPLPSRHAQVVAGPSGLLDDLRDAVGLSEVQLESDAFNRAFTVRSDDRQLAVAVLTPQVIGALLDAGVLVLEVADDLLTIHEITTSRQPTGGQAVLGDRFLGAIETIAAGVRPHTWPTTDDPPSEPTPRGSVAFDPRPPGASHGRGDRRAGAKVRLGMGIVGAIFAAAGAALAMVG